MESYQVKKSRELDRQTSVPMVDGVRRKNLVYGEKTLMAQFELDRGSHLPLHKHPHEQTGYLLDGKIEMVIEGETYELSSGDAWCISGNVEHEVKVLEDTTLVEVFSPVREDFL